MSDTAIIALAGVVTTIVMQLFNAWQMKEKFRQHEAEVGRARAMQIEDSRRTAEALAWKTEYVAADLKRETIANRDAMISQTEKVVEKLDKNTELTGMSYNAANNFELKLERLAQVFSSVHADLRVPEALAEIKQIDSETQALLKKELQPEVPATIKELLSREKSHD